MFDDPTKSIDRLGLGSNENIFPKEKCRKSRPVITAFLLMKLVPGRAREKFVFGYLQMVAAPPQSWKQWMGSEFR